MAQTFLPQGLPIEPESVSNVTATNSVNLGEVRFVSGEEYLYVFNAGAQQISKGQYATLSANSGFSVTVSSVTGYDMPVGFVKHTTLTTATYGWLLTRGFTTIQTISNVSVTTADILYPAANGNVAILAQATSSITGLIFQPIGYCVSGAATVGASTGALGAAYVRCYGT
jgi:hypothetical protein